MGMRFDVGHALPRAEAKQRMEALADYFRNKYEIKVDWNGDKAAIKGKYLVVSIEGTMSVNDKNVDFDGKDPGFLWRGKAKDYLTGKIKTYLDPAKPIDTLPRK